MPRAALERSLVGMGGVKGVGGRGGRGRRARAARAVGPAGCDRIRVSASGFAGPSSPDHPSGFGSLRRRPPSPRHLARSSLVLPLAYAPSAVRRSSHGETSSMPRKPGDGGPLPVSLRPAPPPASAGRPIAPPDCPNGVEMVSRMKRSADERSLPQHGTEMTLLATINSIGERVVQCSEKCEGITCDAPAGRPPRCLYLEDRGDSTDGCIVLGMNPGRAPEQESTYYRRRGTNYAIVDSYWRTRVMLVHDYYTELRRLVNGLGIGGPIVWTEVVKCESQADEAPPVNTQRRCVAKYLRTELDELPEQWPVVAASKYAFDAACYLCPGRAVLGVPHPSGGWSRRQWSQLFRDSTLVAALLKDARSALADRTAVWLAVKDEDVRRRVYLKQGLVVCAVGGAHYGTRSERSSIPGGVHVETAIIDDHCQVTWRAAEGTVSELWPIVKQRTSGKAKTRP